MKKIVITLLWLIAVLIVAFTFGEDVKAQTVIQPVFNVEGVVTDCQNKVPIENVKIILDCSDGTRAEMFTDSDGYYSVRLEGGLSYVITTDPRGAKKTKYSELYFRSSEKGKISTIDSISKTFKKDFCLTPGCGDFSFPAFLFSSNSSDPSGCSVYDITYTDGDSAIAYIVSRMNDFPSYVIEASGHADSRELDPDSLSLERAKQVKQKLVRMGIEADRIVARGYGKSKPLIKDAEITKLNTKAKKETARAKNSRVVFKVLRWDYQSK
jgi:hypothetical protein